MTLLHRITPGAGFPDEVHVIVEIPKGSQNKYEYDPEQGIVTLDRVLYSPLYYPGEYGFVPQTLGPDGDAMDALVLVTYPTCPGVLIKSRPIGLLQLIDQGEEDDKMLCVPCGDVRFDHVTDITDVDQPILNEIAHFFTVYKQLEKKHVEVGNWLDASAAKVLLKRSHEAYKKQ